MSTNPFLTTFSLIQRSAQYVEMFRRDADPTQAYNIYGSDSVNNAYGNPAGSGVGGAGAELLFPVTRGNFFRSISLRRKGLGLSEGNRKGQTHFVFDPEDFVGPGLNLPLDDAWLFLRVQERRFGSFLTIGADPALGAIYCVPPAIFFGQDQPVLGLTGTAPGGTALADGAIPDFVEDLTDVNPRPMHIVFPRPLSAISIVNTSVNDLLLSFGPGQMVQTVASGSDVTLMKGRTKEIIVGSSAAGGTTFRLSAIMGLG